MSSTTIPPWPVIPSAGPLSNMPSPVGGFCRSTASPTRDGCRRSCSLGSLPGLVVGAAGAILLVVKAGQAQLRIVDAPRSLGLFLCGHDQLEIVDAGQFPRLRRFSLWHRRMHMTPDRERDGLAHVDAVGVDPDGAQVLGVKAQLDVLPDQRGVDRETIRESSPTRWARPSAGRRLKSERTSAVSRSDARMLLSRRAVPPWDRVGAAPLPDVNRRAWSPSATVRPADSGTSRSEADAPRTRPLSSHHPTRRRQLREPRIPSGADDNELLDQGRRGLR